MEKVLARLDDHDLIISSIVFEADCTVGVVAGDARPSQLFEHLPFNFSIRQTWPVWPISLSNLLLVWLIWLNNLLLIICNHWSNNSCYFLFSPMKMLSSSTAFCITIPAEVIKNLIFIINDTLIHLSLQQVVHKCKSRSECHTNDLVFWPFIPEFI